MSTDLAPLGPDEPRPVKNFRVLPAPTEVNDVLWPAESGEAIDIGADGVDMFCPTGEGSDLPPAQLLRLL